MLGGANHGTKTPMPHDPWWWALIVVLCALSLLRGLARWQAGRRRLLPSPGAEGWGVLAGRLVLAVPVFALALGHAFAPALVAPLCLPLPAWARSLGLVVTLAALGLLGWTHHALGRHFSPSLRVDAAQSLVTSGPYRYVRHPMYSAYLLFFAGLGLLAADPALGLAGAAVIAWLMIARTPREERQLAAHFGADYEHFAARTGRFLPRRRRHVSSTSDRALTDR